MSTNRPSQVAAAEVRGAAHGEGAPATRQLRAILIAVCIALMAVIASVSGLNVAQPDLAVTFDASQSMILWIINIYALALAALLLPLGALGDRRTQCTCDGVRATSPPWPVTAATHLERTPDDFRFVD